MSASVAIAILLAVPLLPLLAVGAMTITPFRRSILFCASLTAVPGLILALLPETGTPVAIPWLLIDTHLGIDDTGRIFLLLTALLWLTAGFYATGHMKSSPQRVRFWIFFLLCMSGNLGLTLALDMISFYAFFSLMSFAAYGLIIHNNTTVALRAGKIYLWLVVVGEVLLFTALLSAARITDSLLLSDVADALASAAVMPLLLGLFFVAFGIKMGIVPLHFWLPLAHPAAPLPASAVLSGAMIKAGLLGLLRIFPLGTTTLPGWSTALIGLGLLMVFFGVSMGLLQRQPKTLLAYSSISQIGFLLLAIGLGLGAPLQWPLLAPVIGFYALHHGLAKGALFLGVGMSGYLRAPSLLRYVTCAGLLIPALALAGAPLTSGALAKAGLKPFLAPSPLFDGSQLSILLGLAAAGTTLLMVRLLLLLWQQAAEPAAVVTKGMWGGWSLLVTAVGLLGLYPQMLTGLTTAAVAGKWFAALWPVAGGVIIALLFWTGQRKQSWEVHIRDVDVLLESLLRHLAAVADTVNMPSIPRLARGVPWQNLPLLLLLQDTEQQLRQLRVAGVMFVLLLLTLLLL